VKQLEAKWERERAEKSLKQLVQQVSKEILLDSSLGLPWADSSNLLFGLGWRRLGDSYNRIISETEQQRYEIIASQQLNRYKLLYVTTSQVRDPYLKDLYLTEMGLWQAINTREKSNFPLRNRDVIVGWHYLEVALNRAEANGYFGRERQYWALLEEYEPEKLFPGSVR
jgi:hypothetical protein